MDHEGLWLLSEDFAAKFCLPIDAIQAYLPSMKAEIDFLATSEGSSKFLVLLDGVNAELLTKIVEYLRYPFPNAVPSDVGNNGARKKWTKEFVKKLDTEMINMMQIELAKRKLIAEEMVLLESTLEKEISARSAHWKAKMAQKYLSLN